MALTDWVFPEMGYTCEQDKRALYEKKIAPVYSGVTDNRSRVAEGNFCHTLVLPVKISGKRKGEKQMKPYLKAEEIRKEIREQLPVIDEETFREHYCSECMYYAGGINKKARCMNLIIKGKHKKTLIFPVFSGNSVFYSDSCLVVV